MGRGQVCWGERGDRSRRDSESSRELPSLEAGWFGGVEGVVKIAWSGSVEGRGALGLWLGFPSPKPGGVGNTWKFSLG